MDINWWWFNGNFIANLIGGVVSGIVGGITMGIILAFKERFTKYGKEQTQELLDGLGNLVDKIKGDENV